MLFLCIIINTNLLLGLCSNCVCHNNIYGLCCVFIQRILSVWFFFSFVFFLSLLVLNRHNITSICFQKGFKKYDKRQMLCFKLIHISTHKKKILSLLFQLKKRRQIFICCLKKYCLLPIEKRCMWLKIINDFGKKEISA